MKRLKVRWSQGGSIRAGERSRGREKRENLRLHESGGMRMEGESRSECGLVTRWRITYRELLYGVRYGTVTVR